MSVDTVYAAFPRGRGSFGFRQKAVQAESYFPLEQGPRNEVLVIFGLVGVQQSSIFSAPGSPGPYAWFGHIIMASLHLLSPEVVHFQLCVGGRNPGWVSKYWTELYRVTAM